MLNRQPIEQYEEQGSIYDNQTAGKRYFGSVETGGRKTATTR